QYAILRTTPLSLHDALRIGVEVDSEDLPGARVEVVAGLRVPDDADALLSHRKRGREPRLERPNRRERLAETEQLRHVAQDLVGRSEEHTSELQSRENLVCRL